MVRRQFRRLRGRQEAPARRGCGDAEADQVQAVRAVEVNTHFPNTMIPAGPSSTMKITGRKNSTIGTVSLGGSAAARFSASDMRVSRFSWARTRSAVPSGVPYLSDWMRLVTTDFTVARPVRLPRLS